MKKFIIDRFEGSYAVCETEDKSSSLVPKYKLPLGCKEGDCLILTNDGIYKNDSKETDEKKNKIRGKMNRLFK